MKRASRGQSVVELCLSLIVFVTVVMFGIHFAEVGYMSLKVHEAAASPLWDSTALRTHRIRHQPNNIGDFHYVHSIPPSVKNDAHRRYNDFDGRSSTDGKPSVTHVFTQIRGMNVHCQSDAEVEFDVPRGQRLALLSPREGDYAYTPPGQNLGNDTDSVLDGIYENIGGMHCAANAEVQALPSLPTTFLEGTTGFFKKEHAIRPLIRVCSAGRVTDGQCLGRYGILLGDYSFVDPDVTGRCPLMPEQPNTACGENAAYYYASRKVFDANQRSAGRDASAFAEFFVGFSPIDESGFFMSYRPEEDGYTEPLTPPGEPEDEKDRPRSTGGLDDSPATRRPTNSCFLGLQGC
jgi:hypothetical protein